MATNYLDKTGLAKYTKEIKEIIKEAILEDNKCIKKIPGAIKRNTM